MENTTAIRMPECCCSGRGELLWRYHCRS
jgi:hypothetical protein